MSEVPRRTPPVVEVAAAGIEIAPSTYGASNAVAAPWPSRTPCSALTATLGSPQVALPFWELPKEVPNDLLPTREPLANKEVFEKKDFGAPPEFPGLSSMDTYLAALRRWQLRTGYRAEHQAGRVLDTFPIDLQRRFRTHEASLQGHRKG